MTTIAMKAAAIAPAQAVAILAAPWAATLVIHDAFLAKATRARCGKSLAPSEPANDVVVAEVVGGAPGGGGEREAHGRGRAHRHPDQVVLHHGVGEGGQAELVGVAVGGPGAELDGRRQWRGDRDAGGEHADVRPAPLQDPRRARSRAW